MTSPTSTSPELGVRVDAAGIDTNCLVSGPEGAPAVVLVHGSGPGVSAYANWRLTLPDLARDFRVIAPDLVGFGFTDRPEGVRYDLDTWVAQLLGVLDAFGLQKVHLVGNSFGGAVALRAAVRHPARIDRLVLMGSVGVPFEITGGLDAVWGYEPSVAAMRSLLDVFAWNRELVSDELAEVRYAASVRPGVQEAFAAMFPAPRQRWVDAMVTPDGELARLPHPTLVVHGRDDRVIPLSNALHLLEVLPDVQLHVFGRCGHWTQIEHAADFNALVARFFGAA